MKEMHSSRSKSAVAPSGPMTWLDVYAGMLERWIDWYAEVWQPFVDAQAECIRLWQDRCGWPVGEAVSMRGAEQLG